MSQTNNVISTTTFVEFDTLNDKVKQMIYNAIDARKRAYCSYSNFPVGACMETEDGEFFKGCNVENAVLGLTICAEQTAAVKAISEGKRKFKQIAVVAYQENNFTTPCGSCRQFLSEYNPDLIVYVTKPTLGTVMVTSIRALLPHMFDGDIH